MLLIQHHPYHKYHEIVIVPTGAYPSDYTSLEIMINSSTFHIANLTVRFVVSILVTGMTSRSTVTSLEGISLTPLFRLSLRFALASRVSRSFHSSPRVGLRRRSILRAKLFVCGYRRLRFSCCGRRNKTGGLRERSDIWQQAGLRRLRGLWYHPRDLHLGCRSNSIYMLPICIAVRCFVGCIYF